MKRAEGAMEEMDLIRVSLGLGRPWLNFFFGLPTFLEPRKCSQLYINGPHAFSNVTCILFHVFSTFTVQSPEMWMFQTIAGPERTDRPLV